jgi:hypothetical protein
MAAYHSQRTPAPRYMALVGLIVDDKDSKGPTWKGRQRSSHTDRSPAPTRQRLSPGRLAPPSDNAE